MVKIVIIVLSFCLPALAAPSQSIQNIQLKNQLVLTKKILQIKFIDRATLKADLDEIQSNLNLIQGFNVQEQSLRLHKEKAQVLIDLNKVDSDIEALNENISHLAVF